MICILTGLLFYYFYKYTVNSIMKESSNIDGQPFHQYQLWLIHMVLPFYFDFVDV